MSDILLTSSVARTTRGQKCYELPTPIIIKINNPLARYVTIPIRKWNCVLPYAESLWIASGRNDMNMVAHYVKNLYDFSDDKEFMRAGYGPRIRRYNGVSIDYSEKSFFRIFSKRNKTRTVDQFDFVFKAFERDPQTRQAIITIGDPVKDEFDIEGNLKSTKDFPCTRSLHFMKNEQGKLDLIVHMRSNDFIWGASAVNIFNFTFILEYIAAILGLEIGNYYHVVNNFHFYDRHFDLVKQLAGHKNVNDNDFFSYNKKFSNLFEFDSALRELSSFEEGLRKGKKVIMPSFTDDFFLDWAKVFLAHSKQQVQFSNPILQHLIGNKNAVQ